MNPIVIIAPIVGNICAITFFTFTKCGLIGPSSPGSIIAYLSMSPKSQIPLTILGVLIATVVSFLIASPIIRMSDGKSLEDAQDDMAAKKAESKNTSFVAYSTNKENLVQHSGGYVNVVTGEFFSQEDITSNTQRNDFNDKPSSSVDIDEVNMLFASAAAESFCERPEAG